MAKRRKAKPDFQAEVAALLKRRLHPDLLPNPDAISAAKQLLEQVKSGEVIEFVTVTMHRGGEATGAVGVRQRGRKFHSLSLIGAIAIHHAVLCNTWGDLKDEPPETENE